MSAKGSGDDKKRLAELRRELDKTDDQILKLLNKRAEAVKAVGAVKNRSGRAVYVPSREEEIYRRLEKLSPGPLDSAAIRAIWREVTSACRALEQRLLVAYLGPEGTFTHEAALKKFGHSVDLVPEPDIESIFAAVTRGSCDHGVVPVENSTSGSVDEALDLFQTYRVSVIAEVVLPVSHFLIGSGKISDIKAVYSRPIAFNQCRKFLSTTLGAARLMPMNSTAEAVQQAAAHKNSAAIASHLAAELYGVKVIAPHIEDDAANRTRFWVLGNEPGPPTGSDKTSVMFAIKNRSGALHDMLVSFKKHGVNLTKIESRPSRREVWDYVFYVDMEGHAEDAKVAAALKSLEKKCSYMQVIGSYPV